MTDPNLNPLLRVVERAQLEAERRRIMDRAPMEATPLDRLTVEQGRDGFDKQRMHNLLVMAPGIGERCAGRGSVSGDAGSRHQRGPR